MRKKIILSESQLNKAKQLLKEEADINWFLQGANKIKEEVNKIYNIVISDTIIDILENNDNIKHQETNLNNLYLQLSKNYKKASEQTEHLFTTNEELYSKLDNQMFQIYNTIDDKISALTTLIDKLNEIRDVRDEENLTNKFSDIQPHSI